MYIKRCKRQRVRELKRKREREVENAEKARDDSERELSDQRVKMGAPLISRPVSVARQL